MKLHNYANALKNLPENYSGRHTDEVSICIMGESIFATHPEEQPISWNGTEWQKMIFSEEKISEYNATRYWVDKEYWVSYGIKAPE